MHACPAHPPRSIHRRSGSGACMDGRRDRRRRGHPDFSSLLPPNHLASPITHSTNQPTPINPCLAVQGAGEFVLHATSMFFFLRVTVLLVLLACGTWTLSWTVHDWRGRQLEQSYHSWRYVVQYRDKRERMLKLANGWRRGSWKGSTRRAYTSSSSMYIQ